MSLAAGVVAYEPDGATLLPLARFLAARADRATVFVNQRIAPDLLGALEAIDPGLAVVRADLNLGVGEALNWLALDAILAGCDRLALFDQDSRPGPDLLDGLSATLDRLKAEGRKPAAVGPRIVAPRGEEGTYKSPRYPRRRGVAPTADASPVGFLITSGCLVDLAAFRQVGTFRADYFIDGIDLEWCFRAWARGFSCWRDEAQAMEHTVGQGRARGPLATPDQSDLRLSTYARNAAYGWRLAHVPLSWRARSAAYLTLQALALLSARRFDRRFAGLLAGAVRDGLAGRLGPPPGAGSAVSWTPRDG
ncbi:MAG TPA: glycosyltransferase family 2 protein [Beijerinckiaceae bacterium]|jgi:rhamnosyltransferase